MTSPLSDFLLYLEVSSPHFRTELVSTSSTISFVSLPSQGGWEKLRVFAVLYKLRHTAQNIVGMLYPHTMSILRWYAAIQLHTSLTAMRN